MCVRRPSPTRHSIAHGPVNVSLGPASRADASFKGGEHGDSEPALTEQLEVVWREEQADGCARGCAQPGLGVNFGVALPAEPLSRLGLSVPQGEALRG